MPWGQAGLLSENAVKRADIQKTKLACVVSPNWVAASSSEGKFEDKQAPATARTKEMSLQAVVRVAAQTMQTVRCD